MFDFKAYFWGKDVYINEKFRYDSNEILTAYLGNSRAKYMMKSDFVGKLKGFKRCLTISTYMDHYDFSQYNGNVYAAMNLVEKLNDIISSLPPFDKILNLLIVKLDDILNGYDCFFENGFSHIVSACYNIDEDFVNEYGYGEKDDNGNYFLRLTRFDLLPLDKKHLADEDIADEKGDHILCEEIKFNDLGSFLYYDFFNGLKQNYLPNLCKNCGKFFLIRGAWYYTYCDNPLADEPNKTCRDVGSKRRYDDKCKNDPVWQTYNRAYKAHYARYMKKKMTIAQFEEWSRFASEIRDKALAGEITFEQYYADIRK